MDEYVEVIHEQMSMLERAPTDVAYCRDQRSHIKAFYGPIDPGDGVLETLVLALDDD